MLNPPPQKKRHKYQKNKHNTIRTNNTIKSQNTTHQTNTHRTIPTIKQETDPSNAVTRQQITENKSYQKQKLPPYIASPVFGIYIQEGHPRTLPEVLKRSQRKKMEKDDNSNMAISKNNSEEELNSNPEEDGLSNTEREERWKKKRQTTEQEDLTSWAKSKEQSKVNNMLETIRAFKPAARASAEEAKVQHLSNIQSTKRQHQTETRGQAPRTSPHTTTTDHPSTHQLNNVEHQSDALLKNVEKKRRLHMKTGSSQPPKLVASTPPSTISSTTPSTRECP
jgi:hypothetical protein